VGIIGGVDFSPQMQALGRLFQQQVVAPWTFNGQIGYSIDVHADMFGEIVVRLKLDRDAEYIFVQPAFCSASMSPVLTSSPDTLDNIARAFQGLQQEALPSMPVQPLIHDLVQQHTPSGKLY
jgi:hypothetical protein